MGLTRRFLNLIVDNHSPGAKSMRCFDLLRNKLFNTTVHNGNGLEKKQAAGAAFKMDNVLLPKPCFNMRASADQRMHCFQAADRRVFCLNQSGRGVLLEADTSRLVMMPSLHKPMLEPISLYIPCAEPDNDDLDGGGGGNLFIMERIAKPESGCQFEALVYRNHPANILSKTWECELLPLPPYICDTRHGCLKISSYAVVKGGREICISVDGVGTYCFDTVSYVWSEVGKWMLPFEGKVEYVPELKLWFGFSSKDRHFAAADLSTMDSQPQLLDSWQELEPPQGWQQIQDPQLVSLGSGKFCVTRFLSTGTPNSGFGDESICQNVTVLTGVEVSNANGFNEKVNLQMVKHKSRCHKSSCGEDTITAVL